MLETAGPGGAHQIVIAHSVVRAGRGRNLFALLPFDLDRRDREEQRSGKVALGADAGLRDRFLGGDLGDPLAERGRAERLDRHEVDRAGDCGLAARRSQSA